jgi:hypothetical protein
MSMSSLIALFIFMACTSGSLVAIVLPAGLMHARVTKRLKKRGVPVAVVRLVPVFGSLGYFIVLVLAIAFWSQVCRIGHGPVREYLWGFR